jgi:hypothetical protein
VTSVGIVRRAGAWLGTRTSRFPVAQLSHSVILNEGEPFSGAAKQPNEAATARYFGQLNGESPDTGLVGGEGRIRTLGTGYPVRQISNPNRRFHSVRALETEKEESPCRRATSGALCVPLGLPGFPAREAQLI